MPLGLMSSKSASSVAAVEAVEHYEIALKQVET
jgi:hypothetical protein